MVTVPPQEASEADSPVAVVHGVPLPAPTAQLVQFVANNVIGDDDIFTGPYGDRKLTYVGP